MVVGRAAAGIAAVILVLVGCFHVGCASPYSAIKLGRLPRGASSATTQRPASGSRRPPNARKPRFTLDVVNKQPEISSRPIACPERATRERYFANARNLIQEARNGDINPERLAHAERYLCCSLQLNGTHDALVWAYRGVALPGIISHSADVRVRQRAIEYIAWGLRLAPQDPEIIDLLIEQMSLQEELATARRASRADARDVPYSYAALMSQLRNRFVNFRSDNAEFWYKRGTLFERRGFAEQGVDSFLQAWRLEPQHEKYASKMLSVQSKRISNQELLELRESFATQVDNYAAFKVKAQRLPSASLQDQVDDTATCNSKSSDCAATSRGDLPRETRQAVLQLFADEANVIVQIRDRIAEVGTVLAIAVKLRHRSNIVTHAIFNEQIVDATHCAEVTRSL